MYMPRNEIIVKLQDEGARLASPETISDHDLQAIWDVIEGLYDEIDVLEAERDEVDSESRGI